MKLAEALIIRKDLQTRLESLRQRLSVNAVVQEGEKPAEDPAALLKEAADCCARLEQLVSRINLTNARTEKDGLSLTELLSKRDALKEKISIMQSLMDAASRTVIRGSRSEVKILSTVDVSALRKDCDRLSQELRELDTSIQSANWLIDLK